MDAQYITPVERRGDFWFKREDLYKPYDFSPANGSKLRQCQMLVAKNIDKTTNGIITGTSVLSPQAVIAASVAREHGVSCDIFYGGTRIELLKEKKYPSIAMSLGANVEVVTKMGYTSMFCCGQPCVSTLQSSFIPSASIGRSSAALSIYSPAQAILPFMRVISI